VVPRTISDIESILDGSVYAESEPFVPDGGEEAGEGDGRPPAQPVDSAGRPLPEREKDEEGEEQAGPDAEPSTSTLEYTEDFDTIQSTSRLSSSLAFAEAVAAPPQKEREKEPEDSGQHQQQALPPPPLPPPEPSPEQKQGPSSPTGSTEIAEDSIMEELGESFELEAHQQLLEINTKPQGDELGQVGLSSSNLEEQQDMGGQQQQRRRQHLPVEELPPPPSPSEQYTTEFEAEQYTSEWEPEAAPSAGQTEDEAEQLDRVSDLDSLQDPDLVSDLGTEASGPIEAPPLNLADVQEVQEAAIAEEPGPPPKSRPAAKDLDGVAEALLAGMLAEALDKMCEGYTEQGARLSLLTASAKEEEGSRSGLRVSVVGPEPSSSEPGGGLQQPHPDGHIFGRLPGSTGGSIPVGAHPPSSLQEPSSPRAAAATVVNIPQPRSHKRSSGGEDHSDASGSSPPLTPFERSFQSRADSFSEDFDFGADEPGVRLDRKYVASYVGGVMKSFLSSQDISADSMDMEGGSGILSWQGYMKMEGSRPAVNASQGIQNKLIYDSLNEALSSIDNNLVAMAMVDRRAGRALTRRMQNHVGGLAQPLKGVDNDSAPSAVAEAVLLAEAPEHERSRANNEGAEQEAVAEIADMIFDDLSSELVALLVAMDQA